MRRICNCGNTTWRWGTDSSGKPTLYCGRCSLPAENDMFSAEEIGVKLSVARTVIIKLILSQKLEASCIGKQYRVSSQNLQDYIDRNTIKAK